MATNFNRGALLRSLPALLLLLLTGFLAPAATIPAPAPVSYAASASYAAGDHAASDHSAHSGQTVDEPQPEQVPDTEASVGDFTRVVPAQLTAGTRGSRAPPAHIA